MSYHDHNQNYRPEPEKKGDSFYHVVAGVAVFLFIGFLLSWRG
jgi:hypothetical protein